MMMKEEEEVEKNVLKYTVTFPPGQCSLLHTLHMFASKNANQHLRVKFGIPALACITEGGIFPDTRSFRSI